MAKYLLWVSGSSKFDPINSKEFLLIQKKGCKQMLTTIGIIERIAIAIMVIFFVHIVLSSELK